MNLGLIQQDQTTIRSSLVVASTGLGKTVIMGGLARNWPTGRIMMISHRFELNEQAFKTFERMCREPVDLEQSGYMADQLGTRCRIVVASVQTLNAKRKGVYRMKRFCPEDFGLLLIDECHHAAARTYRRVIDYFTNGNPNIKIVGVTATPDRTDKVGLGHVFESVASDLNINWGIENGWLVSPVQKFVNIKSMDLSDIRTVAGDLDKHQLAKLVELDENLHQMASTIVDVCGRDKQSIVFCASVRQSRRVAEIIRDYHRERFGESSMHTAVSVDGAMSPSDPIRKQIMNDFRNQTIQHFCNVGVALEGFDAPNAKVLAIGRPTKSRLVFVQMVGRLVRPLPGVVEGHLTSDDRIHAIRQSDKPDCLVLDFVGQSGQHNLVSTADILAGEKDPPEVVERANQLQKKGDWDQDTMAAILEAREQLAAEREARRVKATVKVEYELKDTGTIYDLSQIPKSKMSSYHARFRVSDKQMKFLIRLGYTKAQVSMMNKKSASEAIDYAAKHPHTPAAKWLAKKRREERKKEKSF